MPYLSLETFEGRFFLIRTILAREIQSGLDEKRNLMGGYLGDFPGESENIFTDDDRDLIRRLLSHERIMRPIAFRAWEGVDFRDRIIGISQLFRFKPEHVDELIRAFYLHNG